MAVTVTGTIAGTALSFTTNSPAQQAFAQAFLSAAGAVVDTLGSYTTTTQTTIGLGVGNIITGGSTVGLGSSTPSQVALGANGSQGQIYFTGASADSVVTTADNSNSSVVNDTPFGNLVATTGAGGNVLIGAAGGNFFVTGNGGSDLVFLDGSANVLQTNGADAVLVGGPSTITAGAGGLDNVLLTTGTTLNFINGSRAGVDSIAGASNSVINLAGTGATSITSGVGPEAFNIDTGAGNVTLNGSLQTNDAITFLKDAATTPGTANVVVNNFAGASVNVHGYAGVEFTIGAAAAGGSTLALTDGSTVTFTNLTTTQLAAVTKVV